MKKYLIMTLLLLAGICFAEVFKVTVKGEAYVKEDTELIEIKTGDDVSNDDIVVIFNDNTTVIINGIRFKGSGTYKLKDYIK